jgi:transposase-like protein
MDYRQIPIKNSNKRYTEEFKDAVRQLIKEGNTYKQIADLFGIDSINSGYRQLIWKLQREVFDSVNVKQLKANNTNTDDTAKVTEHSVAEKSDKIVLPTVGGGMSYSEKRKILTQTAKEAIKIDSEKSINELNKTMKESKKSYSSEVAEEIVPNAGVVPKAKEVVNTLVKDSKVLTSKNNSTEKILPSQDVLSLVSNLDVQIYNLTRLLEAKKMEVSLLESNLETVKMIKEKLVGGF